MNKNENFYMCFTLLAAAHRGVFWTVVALANYANLGQKSHSEVLTGIMFGGLY